MKLATLLVTFLLGLLSAAYAADSSTSLRGSQSKSLDGEESSIPRELSKSKSGAFTVQSTHNFIGYRIQFRGLYHPDTDTLTGTIYKYSDFSRELLDSKKIHVMGGDDWDNAMLNGLVRHYCAISRRGQAHDRAQFTCKVDSVLGIVYYNSMKLYI